ncbi:DapH/DapD/GlmU-related protein [Desulfobacterota bacterium M19]
MITDQFKFILAALRRLQTWFATVGKSSYLNHGKDLHVGKGTRLWAPDKLTLGDFVYIGKHVNIEANCRIGNFCILANRVAVVGRMDHDFRAVGYPVRFAPWVGSKGGVSPSVNEEALIEDDVWVGFGAVILTGVVVGRGAIIAAGSVVSRNVEPYSIVAGVPAKNIGQRFADPADIAAHERAIRGGKFVFSEKGYDYCIIMPALRGDSE